MDDAADHFGRKRGCFIGIAIIIAILLGSWCWYADFLSPDVVDEIAGEAAYEGSQSITETVTWNHGQTGDDYALNDVFSPGKSTAWFAGDMGSIYYTSDAGANFEKKDSGTTEDLDSVWFTDEMNGFAAGSNGAFVRTTDGGNTWVPTNLPVPCMRCLYFMDSKVGYAVGNYGTIYRTEDGGKTWTQQDAGVDDEIVSVAVASDSQAYFTTAAGLYGTTDSGKTWNKVLDTPTPPGDVAVDSSGTTWLVGPSYIYRSTNGKDFELVESAPNVNWAATAANSSTWVGGEGGALYRTDDSGSTWQQEETGSEQDITSMHRNSADEVWTTQGDGLFQFGVRTSP